MIKESCDQVPHAKASETEFRIPKKVAPVICYTTTAQRISGEIFLDVIGTCAPLHLQEFFNDRIDFFPIRSSQHHKPSLLAKSSVVLVEMVLSASLLRTSTSIELSDRKPVLLTLQTMGPVECEMLIDSPDDKSRVLDVLNQPVLFLPVLLRKDTYSLVNKSHILSIEEL